MWLILVCVGGCDVDLARNAEWSAERAFVGFGDSAFPYGRWDETDAGDIPIGARFMTQRECLQALKRAMPEYERRTPYLPDGRGWHLNSITHYPDFVSRFEAVGWVEGHANQMGGDNYACFQEAPLVG